MNSIDDLLNNFRPYRREYFEDHPERYARMAREGQQPLAVVIACSDSRVDPALLFGASPGDLFVIRNIASVVQPYRPSERPDGASAAFEYAVRDLGVGHAIVLGHGQCGGIRAALESVDGRPPARDFLRPWVELVEAPCRAAFEQHGVANATCHRDAEHGAVAQSVQNLATFPWVADAVSAGRLELHGWWFDAVEGRLESVDPETGQSRALVS